MSSNHCRNIQLFLIPIDDRVLVAMGIARGAQWNSRDLFRIAIQPGPIPRSAIRYNSVEGGASLARRSSSSRYCDKFSRGVLVRPFPIHRRGLTR